MHQEVQACLDQSLPAQEKFTRLFLNLNAIQMLRTTCWLKQEKWQMTYVRFQGNENIFCNKQDAINGNTNKNKLRERFWCVFDF